MIYFQQGFHLSSGYLEFNLLHLKGLFEAESLSRKIRKVFRLSIFHLAGYGKPRVR